MKSRAVVLLVLVLMLLLSNVAFAQNDTYTVGLLTLPFYYDTFKARMTELGYVEGQNINYLQLDIPPDLFMLPPEELQAQTQAMLNADVDVFVVNTDTEAVNLRQQTDKPIIFIIADDPVLTGAVADLTTPGGNTTGIVSNRHHERRLQVLTEVIPSTSVVYFLYGPLALEGETILHRVQEVGAELGVEVIGAPAGDPESGIEALQNTPESVDWLFLTPYITYDPMFFQVMFEVAYERNLPIANFIGTPDQYYLINYGPNLTLAGEQAAEITDQIIRGANPGEIPIAIAENSLTVNLEIAAMLGVEIPDAILRQADFIVRPGDFPPLPTPMAGA